MALNVAPPVAVESLMETCHKTILPDAFDIVAAVPAEDELI